MGRLDPRSGRKEPRVPPLGGSGISPPEPAKVVVEIAELPGLLEGLSALHATVEGLEKRLVELERAGHWHCPRCRKSTESAALFECPPSSTCKPIPKDAA